MTDTDPLAEAILNRQPNTYQRRDGVITQNYNFRLDLPTADRLRLIAALNRETMTQAIHRLIREYLLSS